MPHRRQPLEQPHVLEVVLLLAFFLLDANRILPLLVDALTNGKVQRQRVLGSTAQGIQEGTQLVLRELGVSFAHSTLECNATRRDGVDDGIILVERHGDLPGSKKLEAIIRLQPVENLGVITYVSFT